MKWNGGCNKLKPLFWLQLQGILWIWHKHGKFSYTAWYTACFWVITPNTKSVTFRTHKVFHNIFLHVVILNLQDHFLVLSDLVLALVAKARFVYYTKMWKWHMDRYNFCSHTTNFRLSYTSTLQKSLLFQSSMLVALGFFCWDISVICPIQGHNTRLDGAWGKKQIWCPQVQTCGLLEVNVLHWRNFYDIVGTFPLPHSHSAPPTMVWCLGNYAPLDPPGPLI